MSLAMQIGLYILVALTLVAWFIDWNQTVNGNYPGFRATEGLKSARRRLMARHLKAEIHSTALRYRRELNDELNQSDIENGGDYVQD
jgi:hypothetical protein